MRLRLTRTVTQAECSWLDRDYREGEVLLAYPYCTHDSIFENGRAVWEGTGDDYFGLPADALEEVPG